MRPKFFLIVMVLVFFSSSCLAQSTLAFFNADGQRMGTIVRPVGQQSEDLELMSADGYLFQVDTQEGYLIKPPGNFLPETLYWTNDDCTGRSFVVGEDDYILYRGGQILSIGPPDGFLVAVAWGQAGTMQALSSQSLLEPVCQAAPSALKVLNAVEVTTINPSAIGASLIELGEFPGFFVWGFKPPFDARVEKSNIISCSGFESCPAVN